MRDNNRSNNRTTTTATRRLSFLFFSLPHTRDFLSLLSRVMFNEVKEGFIQSVVTSFLPYVSSEREIHEVMLEAKTVREENTDFIDHYTLSS